MTHLYFKKYSLHSFYLKRSLHFFYIKWTLQTWRNDGVFWYWNICKALYLYSTLHKHYPTSVYAWLVSAYDISAFRQYFKRKIMFQCRMAPRPFRKWRLRNMQKKWTFYFLKKRLSHLVLENSFTLVIRACDRPFDYLKPYSIRLTVVI